MKRHNSENLRNTITNLHVTPARSHSTRLAVTRSSIRDGKTVALVDAGVSAIMMVGSRNRHEVLLKRLRSKGTTEQTHTECIGKPLPRKRQQPHVALDNLRDVQCSSVNHARFETEQTEFASCFTCPKRNIAALSSKPNV